jgi:hypothetical protein
LEPQAAGLRGVRLCFETRLFQPGKMRVVSLPTGFSSNILELREISKEICLMIRIKMFTPLRQAAGVYSSNFHDLIEENHGRR